jgi:DNA-binding transcriptional regulator YiaG
MATRAAAINKNQHTPGRSVELLLTVPRFPTRTLGERIKRLRRERGLHQTELARLAGVDEMTLVRWEKDRSVPKGQRLASLLRALGAESSELCPSPAPQPHRSPSLSTVRSINVQVLPA